MSILNAFGARTSSSSVAETRSPPNEEQGTEEPKPLQRSSGAVPRTLSASSSSSTLDTAPLSPPPSLRSASELPMPPKKLQVSSGGIPVLFGEMSASALFSKRREASDDVSSLSEVTEAVRAQKRAEAVSPKGPSPRSQIAPMGSGRLPKPLPALPRTSYPLVVDDDDNDFDASSTSDL
jgi:hypothetical protein